MRCVKFTTNDGMEIEIKRARCDDYPQTYKCDGVDYSPYNLSRKLTNTECEDGDGLFNESRKVNFVLLGGKAIKVQFEKRLDALDLSDDDYLAEVLSRIDIVKAETHTHYTDEEIQSVIEFLDPSFCQTMIDIEFALSEIKEGTNVSISELCRRVVRGEDPAKYMKVMGSKDILKRVYDSSDPITHIRQLPNINDEFMAFTLLQKHMAKGSKEFLLRMEKVI